MRLSFSWLTIALSFATVPGTAQQLVEAGPEQQINTYTNNDQDYPAITTLSNGTFIIVWESYGQDGDEWGVFAQRMNTDGTPIGSEFQVNTTVADFQWEAAVAADPAGNFMIVWESYADGNYDIKARLFDSTGAPTTSEITVNEYTADDQRRANVAATSSGFFLVVWDSEGQDQSGRGIYANEFDSAGVSDNGEFPVNITTANDQNDPKVAALDNGFAITWESDLQDGNDEATVLRYLYIGGGFSDEILVNTFTAGDQEEPAIAVNRDGNVAVVWEGSAQDGDDDGIFGQVFDTDGNQVSPEFQINTYASDDQERPAVAADGDGGFVAVWTSDGQIDGFSDDVFGQRFNAQGVLLGSEFQVNTQTQNRQSRVGIAGGQGSIITAVWSSAGGQDGQGEGIFAQRYEAPAFFADGFESGDLSGWAALP